MRKKTQLSRDFLTFSLVLLHKPQTTTDLLFFNEAFILITFQETRLYFIAKKGDLSELSVSPFLGQTNIRTKLVIAIPSAPAHAHAHAFDRFPLLDGFNLLDISEPCNKNI